LVKLSKGFLIWIKLYTDTLDGPYEWGTIKRFTQEKFDYYKSLLGHQVKITIKPKK
jgi:hypothetical protein